MEATMSCYWVYRVKGLPSVCTVTLQSALVIAAAAAAAAAAILMPTMQVTKSLLKVRLLKVTSIARPGAPGAQHKKL